MGKAKKSTLLLIALLQFVFIGSQSSVEAIDLSKTIPHNKSTNSFSTTKVYKNEDGDELASIQLNPVDKVVISQNLQDRTYSEFINKPMSNEGKLKMAQATGMRYQKGSNGSITLMQNNDTTSDSTRQVDVMLQNLQNMGYEGNFWFGNPAQSIQVVFDTGSAWAWVFSETCGIKDSTCPLRKKRFLQSQSRNFKMNTEGGQELTYGKGYVMGHPSEDQGCFAPDETSCMSKFNFLTVVRGKDLEALEGSGIVGLAPTPANSENLNNEALKQMTVGFVAQLRANQDYNAKFKQVFSLYLSNDGHSPGDITFGGYDLSRWAKPGATLQWMNMASNPYYWSVDSLGVNFGPQKQLAAGSKQIVIFDNGMSLAMAPEKSFIELIRLITEKGFKCKEGTPLWSCQGTDAELAQLPTLEFILQAPDGNSVKVFMPKETYMSYSPEYKEYAVLFSPWNFYGLGGKAGDEYWVLGAQFLQNYYSVYDFKNNKIGMAESITSTLPK